MGGGGGTDHFRQFGGPWGLTYPKIFVLVELGLGLKKICKPWKKIREMRGHGGDHHREGHSDCDS